MSLIPSGLGRRYLPRATLSRRALPLLSPFYIGLMSDEFRLQGGTPPALVSGVEFLRLEEETSYLDFDGMPGMPQKIRASAALLPYSVRWVPTTRNSWIHVPSEEEEAARDLDLLAFNSQIEDLNAQLEEEDDEARKKEIREERNGLQNIVDQLNQTGYLRTSYNAMNTDASGIFWGLAAPNIPLELRSAFSLPQDRAISFRLKRFKAPEEQANYSYTIEFEGGQTLYALVFGDDGNSSEFVHYRSMLPSKREPLRSQLEAILDRGRLTIADRRKLLDLDIRERAIRGAAKKRDGETKLTPEESATIEDLRRQATELKESKKLTSAEESDKQKLEEKLYLARVSFKLQEEANDLLGKAVDVTLIFLRSGYVVIRSGESVFRYENTRITGLEPPVFHFGLPANSRVRIKSTGGKWGLVWGRPKWGRAAGTGVIRSQPFSCATRLHLEPYSITTVGTAIGDASFEGKVVEVRPPAVSSGGVPQSGLYQLELTLRGNQYTPEIYFVGIHRPATPVVSPGEIVWDSRSNANAFPNGTSRILDVLLQDDKRRTRQAQVVIYRGGEKSAFGPSNLPLRSGGLVCDIALWDRLTEVEVPLLTHGYVVRQEVGRVGEVSTASGFAAIELHGSESVVDVSGPEQFLNRPIEALLPADGLWPGDYVRAVCQDAGMPIALLSRIPTGEEAHASRGWKRIPDTRPGRYPHSKPTAGMLCIDVVRGIVQKHCPGGELWSDGLGLVLDIFAIRDRPELTYGTPETGVSVFSPLCLRKQEGLKLTQDLRDYTTSATFIGKIDPKTGLRCSATESIPQADDARFKNSLFHIGHQIPYVAGADDSLTTKADCRRAARDHLHITPLTPDGLPPQFMDAEIDLDPTLNCGDMPRCFGLKMLVDTIEFSSVGDEEGQRMQLNFQLAQDVTAAP